MNTYVVPWHKVWPSVSILLLDFPPHISEKRLLRNRGAQKLKEAICDSSREKEGRPVAHIALQRGQDSAEVPYLGRTGRLGPDWIAQVCICSLLVLLPALGGFPAFTSSFGHSFQNYSFSFLPLQ